MALGEAWLTPRHHSLAASPVCSPGAASRRALHMSSHSKGCRLEDRKWCALSPPWMQKALSPALGLYSQATGRERGVSQVTISTQSRPLGHTPRTSQLDLAPDCAPLPCGRCFITAPCLSPSPSTHSMSLDTAPVCQWHGSFSQLEICIYIVQLLFYLAQLLFPMLTIKAIYV